MRAKAIVEFAKRGSQLGFEPERFVHPGLIVVPGLRGQGFHIHREDVPVLLFEPDNNGTSTHSEGVLSKFLTRVELTVAVDSALR